MRISDWSSDVCSSDLHEEGEQDDRPGKEQHDNLDEILEKGDEPHQLGDGVEDRTSGIESDLRDPSGLEQFCGRKAGAAGFGSEPGKTLEYDPRERVPVADDVAEDADDTRLFDQPGGAIVAFAP